jgi:hypothetical protein
MRYYDLKALVEIWIAAGININPALLVVATPR